MTTKELSTLALAAAAFAMGCTDPSAPTRTLLPDGASMVVDTIFGFPFGNPPFGGQVQLCKTGPEGTYGFDYTVNGVDPTPADATPIDITIGAGGGTVCHTDPVFTSPPSSGLATVVIVEADPAPTTLTDIRITQFLVANIVYPAENVDDSFDIPTRTATVKINLDMARRVTFTNTAPSPTGTEGCTPGYWKQEHHFDSWPSGYDPGDSFNTVFGDVWFTPDITLEDALKLNGGGKNALARHAVAALLNAASGFYPMSEADVIDAVQDAFDAQGTIESTKNTFATNNELGCPLN